MDNEIIEPEVFTPLKAVKAKRVVIKKPDLDTRTGKYFLAKKKVKTKKEAAEIAGYGKSQARQPWRIERSKTYQAIEKKYYKDELLKKITLEQIAHAHAENILQNEDLSARNAAIKMAVDKLEPDKVTQEDDRVYVILKEE